MKPAKLHFFFIALALSAGIACDASADTFSETFTNMSLSPDLLISNTTGFSFTLTNSQGLMSEQNGAGNGLSTITTSFQLVGDFTATVMCSNIDLAPDTEAGLSVNATNGCASDIFFYSDQINANMRDPGQSSKTTPTTASEALFQIVRTGNTLSCQYETGSGLQTLYSLTNTNFAAPMTVTVFLINEYGNTDFHSASFNNLDIVADQFFPPLQPVVLSINPAPAVLVSWQTVTNVYYQVQEESALTTNNWVNVGQPMPGTGGTMSITNWTVGQPQNYFRVLESLTP